MIFGRDETLDEVAIYIENNTRRAVNWYKLNETLEKFQVILFGLKEDHEIRMNIDSNNMIKLQAQQTSLS